MATPPGKGEPLEPLTYKTWVLKVSIHCEGCKRKVKRVLLTVQGVYDVNIDIKQQKAIVTGNVDAETLIKKLEKSGKHAELWPQVAEQQEKKSRKSKNKEKLTDSETRTTEEGGHGGPEKEKPPVKVEAVQNTAKITEGGMSSAKHGQGGGGGGGNPANNSEGGGGGGAVKIDDSGAKSSGGGGGRQAAESKSEGKKPVTGSAGNESPVADKKGGESESGADKSGGDSGGKKEKNEGHKSPAKSEPSSSGAPASTGSRKHSAGPLPANLIPPRHHGYQYPPPQYYASPPSSAGGLPNHYGGSPPVNLSPPRHQGYQYAVSYSTAYPTSSNTTSYYASPPRNSYAYTHPGPETEPPPSDLDSYPRQPLDSFEMFSDENPNGCFIM